MRALHLGAPAVQSLAPDGWHTVRLGDDLRGHASSHRHCQTHKLGDPYARIRLAATGK